MPRSIAEQIMYSTTRISSYRNNIELGKGTAFFYRIDVPDSDGAQIPVLVTNKHNLDGADSVSFRAHIMGKDGKPNGKVHQCRLETTHPNVVQHSDDNVDLCAIIIGSILREAEDRNEPIFYVNLDETLIPTKEEWENFDAIENLLMVGCPRGIYDEVNNLPIFRRGNTATPLGKNYEGNDAFLVDMDCYPGSSGSPIFVYDQNGYLDIANNAHVMGQRVKFVGVLFRGPVIDSQGRIIFHNIPRVEVKNMMHLGEAVKSTEVDMLSKEVLSFARIFSKPAR